MSQVKDEMNAEIESMTLAVQLVEKFYAAVKELPKEKRLDAARRAVCAMWNSGGSRGTPMSTTTTTCRFNGTRNG